MSRYRFKNKRHYVSLNIASLILAPSTYEWGVPKLLRFKWCFQRGYFVDIWRLQNCDEYGAIIITCPLLFYGDGGFWRGGFGENVAHLCIGKAAVIEILHPSAEHYVGIVGYTLYTFFRLR